MSITGFVACLICASALTLVAATSKGQTALDKKISITIRNATLEKALDQIGTVASVTFSYGDFGAIEEPLSFTASNEKLGAVLTRLLADRPFTFMPMDDRIIIKYTPEKLKQKQTVPPPVTGKVTDEKGQPLPGASVKVKGTQLVTVTNAAGEFKLQPLSANSVLVISYVGYQPLEVLVGKDEVLSIVLQLASSKLDEVVIIPYGTTTQRLNTGSVGKVTAAEIEKQPVSDPLATLEGRVPGLVVTQSTGLPGASFRVQVRGRTAIATNITDDQPLFIIDGVPFAPNNSMLSTLPSALGSVSVDGPLSGGMSPLSTVNPQDIESIEVLKDADATAIYGSRGANGVILITTKKGKAGKTLVNANVYSGFSKATKMVESMNTQQYLATRRQAFISDNVTPTPGTAYDLLVWDTTRYTNFNKLLTGGTATSNDAQLTVSGGVTNTQFLVGGSFHKETTITPGDLAYNRGTFHFNINHATADQKFKVSLTGSYASDLNELTGSDLAGFAIPPNMQIYDKQGNLAWNEGGYSTGFNNPLAYLNNRFTGKTANLLGNLQLNYSVAKDLTLRLSSGYNSINSSNNTLYPSTAQNPANTINRTHSYSVSNFKSWIIEPQMEYIRQISKGKLDILIGGTAQSIDNDGNYFNASGYTSDNLINSTSGATAISAGNSLSQYRYEALFGRINYNWQDKYLINFSARRDGSSRFGPDKQFANFWATGAAWIFTNENFLKDHLNFISFGKIRGSYGITGNDKITDYNYLDTWTTTTYAYNGTVGLFPNKLYNPDYRWEKTTKLEGALELGFLKDRILLTGAYYDNRSSNQLVVNSLPATSGGSVIQNFPATVKNSGWEFTLNTTNVKSKDITWSSSFNVSLPQNKLVSYPGLATSNYYATYVEGQSLSLIYKYRYTGVDPQTGLFTFEDLNKNGTMDQRDYQYLGKTDPVLYGGFQNTFRYKSFQLDLFFSFKKSTGYNYLASIGLAPGTIRNLPAALYGKFWSKPGDVTELARLTQITFGNVGNNWADLGISDGSYGDASYIRLKNMSVSYTLPQIISDRFHINKLRFYVLGQNLLTISGYKLGDPETQRTDRTPPLQVFTAGIQLSL